MRHQRPHAAQVDAPAEGQRAISSAIALLSMPLTTGKIRAFVDNIMGKKDRFIESEVVKKDDDDD
jgi:hypothetical protein